MDKQKHPPRRRRRRRRWPLQKSVIDNTAKKYPTYVPKTSKDLDTFIGLGIYLSNIPSSIYTSWEYTYTHAVVKFHYQFAHLFRISIFYKQGQKIFYL